MLTSLTFRASCARATILFQPRDPIQINARVNMPSRPRNALKSAGVAAVCETGVAAAAQLPSSTFSQPLAALRHTTQQARTRAGTGMLCARPAPATDGIRHGGRAIDRPGHLVPVHLERRPLHACLVSRRSTILIRGNAGPATKEQKGVSQYSSAQVISAVSGPTRPGGWQRVRATCQSVHRQ